MQSFLTSTAIALVASTSAAFAQEEPEPDRKLRVSPVALALELGDKVKLEAWVEDADGKKTDEEVFFFSRSRRSVTVDEDGNVEAVKPGTFTIVVRTQRKQGNRLTVEVPVEIARPPLTGILFVDPPSEIFEGATRRVVAVAFDATGARRPEEQVRIDSDKPAVATIDAFGHVTAHSVGTVEATARLGEFATTVELRVVPNPVATIELAGDMETARTGEVVHFSAVGRTADGAEVAGAPIHLTFVAEPEDGLGPPASGQIEQDGRFVAETPGLYTILASCGRVTARAAVRAVARDVGRKIEVVGHGEVFDVHTSDFWVWEGVDGRDYAVTGTWGANGDAIFWDVTDPEHMEEISRVTVDARTVNDVKVSADGRLCVISREGASNRKNGFVVIDVVDPRDPKIVSVFDDKLTGGVHNVFIYDGNVFALSAGRRYDVINIEDAASPRRVGTFELDSPGHSIHDVWVVDGLAYSSNWGDGIQIVDVGNGIAGGSPENPVRVGGYAYPSGWNHAAFPYKSPSTGTFYVVAGDEAFPYGLHVKDTPNYPRGWFHFVDFTDMEHPREVARYQVPEAGSHNLWVEGDILYAAYYNAGLRIVDISGELMGDLYRQGREIGWFLPTDKDGVIPNASMVWGPQPHKGNVFFTDWNTGLWAVRLGKKTVWK